MANRVPDKLSNFKAYLNGSTLLGVVDVELPSLESMTSEIQGAGFMGVMETPVPGHFNSTTITLNFRTPTSEANQLFLPVSHHLELRAALQQYNAGTGALEQKGYEVSLRVFPKSPSLGKMAVASAMESGFEMEVSYMRISYKGVPVLMLDKANFIFLVNGVDVVKSIRDLID